jgi:hypothetical protein
LPRELLHADGVTLCKTALTSTEGQANGRAWAEDPVTGARRDLTREESTAFWTWAAVEVLRATGIRLEELTELSHHSMVQYRLPSTFRCWSWTSRCTAETAQSQSSSLNDGSFSPGP